MTGRRRVCVVTGATGLLGRHLLPRLAAEWDVIALVRRAHDSCENVTDVVRDLSAANFTDGLPTRVDAVVHLAQSNRFREFPDGAADVLAVNVAATEQLTRYALRAGAERFVLASSGGVYAPSSAPLVETARLVAPELVGWYQASKLAAEAVVHAHRAQFVPVVLRPFFLYGAGQQRHMLLPRLCDSVRAGAPVQLAGRDGIVISPTHAADAARCVMQALTLTSPATINVRGPDALSLRSICDMLGDALGTTPHYESTTTAPASYVGDDTRMHALLGPPTQHLADYLHTILT